MEPDQGIWASVARHFSTSTALNPIIAICAITTPLALILAAISSASFAVYFLYLAAVPVVVAAMQILGFSLFSPDRLHDNKHVEKKWAMSKRIGHTVKGKSVETTINPNAPLLDNPAAEKDVG